MFSALSMTPFRTVKLRARRPTCAACGILGERVGKIEETDYVALCGGTRPDWLARGLVEGSPERRIKAKVRGPFATVLYMSTDHTVGLEGNFGQQEWENLLAGCSTTDGV